jgi:hypothetical protein
MHASAHLRHAQRRIDNGKSTAIGCRSDSATISLNQAGNVHSAPNHVYRNVIAPRRGQRQQRLQAAALDERIPHHRIRCQVTAAQRARALRCEVPRMHARYQKHGATFNRNIGVRRLVRRNVAEAARGLGRNLSSVARDTLGPRAHHVTNFN